MDKLYKNFLDLSIPQDTIDRKREISKEIVRHNEHTLKPVTYEDIDNEMKSWVESAINIIQDDVKLPTMVLYSNQRFSEYLQTWRFTDENNNIRLNFKTITRENNPSHGTIVGDTYNIPNNKFYTYKSIEAINDAGKKYRIDYKMRQPTPVDLTYRVSILTNRYTSINKFNEIVNTLFNSKQVYICPNGHYMSFVLDNISDESEYNIEDRQFFSQTITLKLKAYIINESDIIIEENPISTVVCFEFGDGRRNKPIIELSESDPCFDENEELYKKQLEIDVDFTFCYPFKGKTTFTIDEDFTLTSINFKEPNNIITNEIKLFVNDELISEDLVSDTFEGYKLLPQKPNDVNENNTLICDKLPSKINKNYKYISYNNEFYIWHQINFKDGDEITIQTKKEKRYVHTGGFVLIGYNKFISHEK